MESMALADLMTRTCTKHGIEIPLSHSCALCILDLQSEPKEEKIDWANSRFPEGAEL